MSMLANDCNKREINSQLNIHGQLVIPSNYMLNN